MFGLPKSLIKLATKIKGKRKIFQEYMELNDDILTIVEDIDSLKEKYDINKNSRKIELLKRTKKDLEAKLIDIEEEFYDIEKGLWIGVAYDLTDVDAEPFLLYLEWNKIHNHMEIFGTSGYGKSRLMAVIVRQFIHYHWSTFVVDPKGGENQEVAGWIYDFAAEAGLNHLVTRIMPSYPHLSDKANPIFGMSDIEISSLCSFLTVGGSGSQNSQEQFYSGQVLRITYAILSSCTFLENAISPDKIEVNKRVLQEVKTYIKFKENGTLDNIYSEDAFEYPDKAKLAIDSGTNGFQTSHSISPYNRTLITFRELAYFSAFENLEILYKEVKNTPIPILPLDKIKENEISAMKVVALRALNELIEPGKEYYNKTGSSLSILLSQLAYGPVGSVMCDIRINPLIKRVRDKEGMIVLFQPAPMKFEKVSEIMIKVYTRMWLSLFGTIGSSGRGLVNRVAYIIDEAKPMMFPGVEEIYNKARQLGMTMVALYQSKSDLKFKLGRDLADIVQDNTGTSITMKQVSMSSREEAAASFGTTKIAENVQMTEVDGGGRTTIMYNQTEFVAADDINSLQIAEGFVSHYGKKWFVKFPYQRDPMPIDIVMPKLEEEHAYDFIAQAEAVFNAEKMHIDAVNRENSKKLSELEAAI